MVAAAQKLHLEEPLIGVDGLGKIEPPGSPVWLKEGSKLFSGAVPIPKSESDRGAVELWRAGRLEHGVAEFEPFVAAIEGVQFGSAIRKQQAGERGKREKQEQCGAAPHGRQSNMAGSRSAPPFTLPE